MARQSPVFGLSVWTLDRKPCELRPRRQSPDLGLRVWTLDQKPCELRPPRQSPDLGLRVWTLDQTPCELRPPLESPDLGGRCWTLERKPCALRPPLLSPDLGGRGWTLEKTPASLGFLGRLSVYAGAVTRSSSSPAGFPILLFRLSVRSSAGWTCASSASSSAPSSPPTSTSPGSMAIASGDLVTKTRGYRSATTRPSGVFRRPTWTSMRKWNRNVQTDMINIAQQGQSSSCCLSLIKEAS